MTMASLSVLSMWYNEEFLAPFFLNHYSYADHIHIILDADTTDKSLSIIEKYSNASYELFKFPDMMNEVIKSDQLNNVYKKIDSDWVLVADADEFICLPTLEPDIKEFLDKEPPCFNVVIADLFQIYRHCDDHDLDMNLLPVPQRRHGDPNISTGPNALYSKPSVIRGKQKLYWGPGHHAVHGETRYFNHKLIGAHWANADPCFCIERRIKGRKLRQSKFNLLYKLSSQNHNITEESVLEECRKHLNDPKLF